jgi:hypothetical protein
MSTRRPPEVTRITGTHTFSGRLRDELDLDTLATELLAVVDQTMQPTTASLWLRPSLQESGRTRT